MQPFSGKSIIHRGELFSQRRHVGRKVTLAAAFLFLFRREVMEMVKIISWCIQNLCPVHFRSPFICTFNASRNAFRLPRLIVRTSPFTLYPWIAYWGIFVMNINCTSGSISLILCAALMPFIKVILCIRHGRIELYYVFSCPVPGICNRYFCRNSPVLQIDLNCHPAN